MAYLRDAQRDVEQFHRAAGQHVGDQPAMPDEAERRLRASLIAEEVAETISALGLDCHIYLTDRGGDPNGDDLWTNDVIKPARENLAEVADGIADSIYVELGTAVSAGIDMEPVWEAVQMSNISKMSGPRRADGKQLKPEGWQPPDVEGILRAQRKAGCDFGCCAPAEPAA